MENKKHIITDKKVNIGCGVVIILFIVACFFKCGCNSSDPITSMTKEDSIEVSHKNDRSIEIKEMIVSAKKYVQKNDTNGLKMVVSQQIESQHFMETLVDDKLYDRAVKLYPKDYVKQQSFYEDNRKAPKFAKINDHDKEKIEEYYDKMHEEADSIILEGKYK